MTVDYHPQSSKLPHISAAEAATHATKDLSAALRAPNTNAPFAALGDEQLQALRQLSSIFEKATHPNKSVPPPRVINNPPQSAQLEKGTPLPRVQPNQLIATSPSPRVRHHNKPHVIPMDEDSEAKLPLPRPHPISVPTPKGGSFYIPPEEDDISQGHRYPTRNRGEHRANFWPLSIGLMHSSCSAKRPNMMGTNPWQMQWLIQTQGNY